MDHSGTIEIYIPDDDRPLSTDSSSYIDSTRSSELLVNDWKTTGAVILKHMMNIKSVRPANFRKRIIKSAPVIVILIINLLQSFCFFVTTNATFQVITNFNNSTTGRVLQIGAQTGGFSALFFPIGGILGDVYLGRHVISVICMFISFITSAVHAVLLSLWNSSIIEIDASNDNHLYLIPVFMILVLTISDGMFQVNWLSFGADQLINSPSEEVSSYIYWWSWTKNLGLVLAIVTHTALRAILYNYQDVSISMICVLISSTVYFMVLIMDLIASCFYDRKRNNSNPIKLICGIYSSAYTTRSRPKLNPYRSAFRYGEDPPSGLDHALERHGGVYTEEDVESVRSCGRIALMIIAMSGYFVIYFAFHSQLAATNFNEILNNITLNTRNFTMEDSLGTFIDSSLMVVLLPVWNLVLLPVLGHYAPNTRKRVGFGSILGVIGILAAAIIAQVDSNKNLVYYMLLPLIIIVIGETFAVVPALEFIYAQSPDNMKGLLIGFQYFLIGVWAAVKAIITIYCNSSPEISKYYYWGYFGLGFVGLCVFMIISSRYRNRKRNNPITDIMRISSYY